MELKCPQFAPVRSKTEAEGYRPSAWHNSLTRRPDGSRRYRCHGSSRPAGPGHLDADPNPAPPSDAPGKLNGYDVHSPEHVARRVPGNTGFQFNPDAIPADTCRMHLRRTCKPVTGRNRSAWRALHQHRSSSETNLQHC